MRPVTGAAGEIGYLPVPGVPLPQDVGHPATGGIPVPGRRAGGAAAGRVVRLRQGRPQVVPAAADGRPVLRGAVLAAVDQARRELLASVAAY